MASIACIKVDSTLINLYIVFLTMVTMVINYLAMKCVTIVFAKFRHFLVLLYVCLVFITGS